LPCDVHATGERTLVDKPDSGLSAISVGTAYGLWIALLASIAVVVDAYLRMSESPT
jgi:hypothetical protein